MAQTITIQVTLDDDVKKNAEAALKTEASGTTDSSESMQDVKVTKESRLAAWNELKKYQRVVKRDICYKTELENARNEKYADFI